MLSSICCISIIVPRVRCIIMAYVGGSCAVDDAENIGLNFDVCFCPLSFFAVFHFCINNTRRGRSRRRAFRSNIYRRRSLSPRQF